MGKSLTHSYIWFKVLVLIAVSNVGIAQSPDFHWIDTTPEDRTEVGIFMKTFELESLSDTAVFRLFADSRYLLRVNGVAVGSGPSRFFPERLYFDTYDLLEYLQVGKNTIAVKVLSHGSNTFQTPKSIGRIWSDGFINTNAGRSIDLKMGTTWLCRRYYAHDTETHKMNFALGPLELHDYKKDLDKWYEQFETIEWQKPVALPPDSSIKHFLPREIPFLNQKEITPRNIISVRPFKEEYQIAAFHLRAPDATREETSIRYPSAAYTYISSPIDQEVEVLLWWGEYFLNGEAVKKSNTKSELEQAIVYKLTLKKGKNLFIAKSELKLSSWHFYMAFPKTGQLSFGTRNSDETFGTKVFKLSDKQEWEQLNVNQKPSGFQVTANSNGKLNPVWNIAWQGLKEPISENVNFPITIDANSGITIDFGQKRLGRVVIEYEAPAGVSFDLSYTEDLKDKQPHTLKRHMMFIGSGFISGGGNETFKSFRPYGLRYIQLNVRGPRQQKVTIKSVKVIDETFPYDINGTFTSSDETLNEIWKLGPNTLTACSEDAYLDTPYRERGTYAGDALPTYAINLVLDNDSRILKNTLNYLRGSFAHRFLANTAPRADGIYGNPDDFPLLFIQSLNWYYERTGDVEFLKECYPEIKFLLNNWLKQKNDKGTFTTPERAFIEWVEIDKFAGEHTVVNAYLCEAFKIYSRWAMSLGDKAESELFLKEHQQLKSAITNEFWDEKEGTYRDGTINNKPRETIHPLAAAVCLLYDITPLARVEKSLTYIEKALTDIGNVSRKRKATPYGSFYILNALYKHDRAGSAEKFIKKHWLPMVVDGADTAWENFDNTGIGTLSHVWSSHPTYFLSTQALGVGLEFGNISFSSDTLQLMPHSASLTWAKGAVPHPVAGLVEIDWEIKGDKLFYNYNTENSVIVDVSPRGKLKDYKLYVNGQLAN